MEQRWAPLKSSEFHRDFFNGDVEDVDLPQEIGMKMVTSSELMEMLKLMYDKCGEHNSNNYALY